MAATSDSNKNIIFTNLQRETHYKEVESILSVSPLLNLRKYNFRKSNYNEVRQCFHNTGLHINCAG